MLPIVVNDSHHRQQREGRIMTRSGTSSRRHLGRALGLAAALASAAWTAEPAAAADSAAFNMVRSANLPGTCAPRASAAVRIQSQGFAERMTVRVFGLPPGTELDLFAIQVPDFPFGVGWYVGDLRIGRTGSGAATFVSRFNIETFALALNSAPAPQTHPGDDATRNPPFKPVHTYHLGLWFNSPDDARRAGCPTGTTPFNGDHTAGVQVLSTRNFPPLRGPLSQVD
jgi:hypothetical protein